jgi:hypothetical protein
MLLDRHHSREKVLDLLRKSSVVLPPCGVK